MNRRQFLRVAAPFGTVAVAGCAQTADRRNCISGFSTPAGPARPYDTLELHEMPEYVTEYDRSVVVDFEDLTDAGKRAVRAPLEAEGEYRECTDDEGTDVMALFSVIERRWEAVGRESFAHTYLHHEGTYYGIEIVHEGDVVKVWSIPCTDRECPATPTPPP